MFTRTLKQISRTCLLASLIALAPSALSLNHSGSISPDTLNLRPVSPQWQLAQGAISKSQAAAAAKQRYGGKVLSVSKSGNVYRVKLLLDSGKVIIVAVDARSGKVLGS